MHIAAAEVTVHDVIPSLRNLRDALDAKVHIHIAVMASWWRHDGVMGDMMGSGKSHLCACVRLCGSMVMPQVAWCITTQPGTYDAIVTK
jgi:hypothetical protein